MWKILWLNIILLIFLSKLTDSSIMKWLGMQCVDIKKSNDTKLYNRVEICRMKAIRRDYSEMNIKVSLYELPITNVSVRLKLLQKTSTNVFQTFLYDIDFDYCKLMRNSRYPLSFEKFVFEKLRPYSNLNSTCPWNKPFVIIEKFGLTSDMIALPFPSGIYRMELTFSAYSIPRFMVKINFLKEE